MNPITPVLTDEQATLVSLQILSVIEKYSIVEKPLTIERAADFLGLSVDSIHRLRRQGVISPHYIGDLSTPFYFPSEMVGAFKRERK